jgi:hypothetical protein
MFRSRHNNAQAANNDRSSFQRLANNPAEFERLAFGKWSSRRDNPDFLAGNNLLRPDKACTPLCPQRLEV